MLVVLFFATANYSNDGRRVRYINRAPIASVSWGPSEFYIVRDGINIVWDSDLGAPGNVVEFSITAHTRISMRLLTGRRITDVSRGGWVWMDVLRDPRRRPGAEPDEFAFAASARPGESKVARPIAKPYPTSTRRLRQPARI
ncbi:MAG TPA: hypothetical protein VN325_17955 [Steroidobacteraceae bacterium]|nr:hypothetical protein [Steroidobacteraceae bacterium]